MRNGQIWDAWEPLGKLGLFGFPVQQGERHTPNSGSAIILIMGGRCHPRGPAFSRVAVRFRACSRPTAGIPCPSGRHPGLTACGT